MFFQTLALILTTASAAVIHTFHDGNCKDYIGETNVYDNSCSNQPAFSSYMIVTAGGTDQKLTTYSGGECVGDQTACDGAGSVNVCYTAINSNGASNAVGSGVGCGVV